MRFLVCQLLLSDPVEGERGLVTSFWDHTRFILSCTHDIKIQRRCFEMCCKHLKSCGCTGTSHSPCAQDAKNRVGSQKLFVVNSFSFHGFCHCAIIAIATNPRLAEDRDQKREVRTTVTWFVFRTCSRIHMLPCCKADGKADGFFAISAMSRRHLVCQQRP
jgi:hypothetical protein